MWLRPGILNCIQHKKHLQQHRLIYRPYFTGRIDREKMLAPIVGTVNVQSLEGHLWPCAYLV